MAGPELLTISVIVPSIGRGVLADVVRRSLEQDPLEVIVVADAQPETVAAVLASARLDRDPRLLVIPGPGRGGAHARQRGLEASRGDLVLFIDDDVVPAAGLLDGHRRAHENSMGLVVVGYLPVGPDLAATSVTARIYSGDYETECTILDAEPERVLQMVWGGNLSMRREDGARVPQSVDSYEGLPRQDAEFGFRCARAGLVGVFDRSLLAAHRHQRTVSEFLALARRQAIAGEVLASQYPDLIVDADPTAGLSRRVRNLARLTRAPLVGRSLQAFVVAVATRVGRGAPTRWRMRAVLFARAVVQINATQR